MNTNGRVRNQEPNVSASFSELTHDAIELAELQAQLFAIDIKNTTHKTRTSLVFAAIGLCLLLGSIPVLLFAIAHLFIEQLGWSHAAGFAIAALIGIALSGSALVAGWLRFKAGLSTIQRSREELRRNIAWIKSSLRSQRQTHAVVKH